VVSATVVATTTLVTRIQAAHEAAQAGARTALENAVLCGELLLQAKDALEHGQWLPWLAANTTIGVRQAQNYMRVAKHREALAANAKSSAHLSAAVDLLAEPKGSPAALPYSDNPEWYTPPEYIEAARQVLGTIDVDPASNDIAQQVVRASTYYTAETDGLVQEWRGRAWLNPPYSKNLIAPFVRKLLDEYRDGNVPEAVLLTHARTDAGWFHEAADAAAAICFTRGRISFRTRDGTGASPTDGSVFFYLGPNLGRFAVVFGSFGLVYGRPMQVHRHPMLAAAA
jgi:phage N-6-adenine-methyltransferase